MLFRSPHPATFPSKLPEQCLRLHGLDRIRTVMDPFTGLGSTAVACARLGLNYVGSEIDETYLQEAVRRVEDASRTQAALPPRAVKMSKIRKAGQRRAATHPSAAAR